MEEEGTSHSPEDAVWKHPYGDVRFVIFEKKRTFSSAGRHVYGRTQQHCLA